MFTLKKHQALFVNHIYTRIMLLNFNLILLKIEPSFLQVWKIKYQIKGITLHFINLPVVRRLYRAGDIQACLWRSDAVFNTCTTNIIPSIIYIFNSDLFLDTRNL